MGALVDTAQKVLLDSMSVVVLLCLFLRQKELTRLR